MPIETPYSKLQALIVDDMATQQTTLRGQLAMLGIGKVDVALNADDALRLVRSKAYGLILCDFNLNHRTDGQQFFEHLREHDLLPPDCLFFMVTAENGYASVAAATEHCPDAYLLKPITAADVEERLKGQLERRRVFAPVHARLARRDLPAAVLECDALLARKDRWFVQALQLKGQLLLQLGRHEDAKAVYLAALAQRPQLVWAQLGLARAHKATGAYEEAKLVAHDIIHSRDGAKTLAAYDVVAEALEAQGDAKGAQWVLRDAAAVVPSARRLRLVAESAYRNGDLDTAHECLAKVTKATKGSMSAQPQDTLMLAQALVDLGRGAEAAALLDEAAHGQRGNPQFEPVALSIKAQGLAKAGDAEGAAKLVARARETLRTTTADFATVALAKAELVAGDPAAGLKLMQTAVASDHENPRVKQWIANALADTGHADKVDEVVHAAAAGLDARVAAAKTLFRDHRIDDALTLIEAAVKEYPENTGVLLQAAQMNCLSLRLKKQLNAAVVEKVRLYLARLEKLMPASDRMTQMQRYYRETVAMLTARPAT